MRRSVGRLVKGTGDRRRSA